MLKILRNSILYFSLMLKSKRNIPSNSVYIELLEVSTGAIRRLSHIYYLFKETGYHVFVHIPFRIFISRKNFFGITSDKEFLLVSRTFRKKDIIVVSDTPETSRNKTVCINYNIFTDKIDTSVDVFYPIGFHPDLMSKKNESLARSLSGNNERKIAAFFAGNILERKYTNKRTKEYFNINTRYEIVQSIQDTLSKEYLYFPVSYEDLLKKMESGFLKNKIVIMNTQKAGIPQHEWLRLLSETNYFIYTPGILYPWCHNQIESMAAGSIPITQFPHIFHPNLRNQENCFTWKTTDELVEILKEITNGTITVDQTTILRDNINAYYQSNFSFGSFIKRIDKFLEKDTLDSIQLYICAGEHSMK